MLFPLQEPLMQPTLLPLHQILLTEPPARTCQLCRLWLRCLKTQRKAWGTAVPLQGILMVYSWKKNKFHHCFEFGPIGFWFLYIVRQNSATETFFVIPGGTLGLILHVGFVHLHIFAVTLSLFLSCANSLWQRSLVLLSHCLLTDFTSSPSLSYFSPLCSRNKDSIVLPWQHTHVTWCMKSVAILWDCKACKDLLNSG